MSSWEEDPLLKSSALMCRQVKDLRTLVKKLKLDGGEVHDANEKVLPEVPSEAPAAQSRENAAPRRRLAAKSLAFGRGPL
jgi:hypothetical protein